MGKYHIFQEITEFAPKILKTGEIYTDSEMCWLEALKTLYVRCAIGIGELHGLGEID